MKIFAGGRSSVFYPFGGAAFAVRADGAFVAELTQDEANHVAAGAGAVGFNIGNGKGTYATGDGVPDEFGFCAAPFGNGSNAFFKFTVGTQERSPEVVEPWVGVVFAGVPVLRAGFERFVVGFLGLLEDAFEADVASNIVVEVIEKHQGQ